MDCVFVFVKKDCVFCTLAEKYLQANKIKYEIKKDYDMEELMSKTGSRKFPQIFIDEVYVGGYDDLKNLHLSKASDHKIREIKGEIVEPMAMEKKEYDRFILFDGKKEKEYSDIYKLFKQQNAAFWTIEEIDLDQDLTCWKNSSDDEKHFIKMILAFFASLDEVVMENINVNFADEIKNPIVRIHFGAQNYFECIHAETYSTLIQTYIKDWDEQRRILKSAQTMPVIAKKIEWVESWMNPQTQSLAERLVAFLALEGIQFSAAFCAIYWLKSQSRFPGFCFANSLIARDEALHAEGSVLLYKHLENKLPESRVHEIIKSAVDIEKVFIEEALPIRLIGMNVETMSEYLEYVADFWLVRLGYNKIYSTKNPYPWMELIGMEGKTNFFELRVGEYSKSGVLVDDDEKQFSLDADF